MSALSRERRKIPANEQLRRGGPNLESRRSLRTVWRDWQGPMTPDESARLALEEAHEAVCVDDSYPHPRNSGLHRQPDGLCLGADCCNLHDDINRLARAAWEAAKQACSDAQDWDGFTPPQVPEPSWLPPKEKL